MSDIAIFVVGVFAFLLLSGGFGFTYLEFRRLDEEAEVRSQKDKL